VSHEARGRAPRCYGSASGCVSSTHGPLAFIAKDLPTGLDDFFWMLALAGLGIALTFGIFMAIAGIGGFAPNVVIWFSLFPPAQNPIIDPDHTIYALVFLLLMFLHAGNVLGFGRWWSARTPRILH
jgi:thiosulfate dehydrogenase [quinone] large subunit